MGKVNLVYIDSRRSAQTYCEHVLTALAKRARLLCNIRLAIGAEESRLPMQSSMLLLEILSSIACNSGASCNGDFDYDRLHRSLRCAACSSALACSLLSSLSTYAQSRSTE